MNHIALGSAASCLASCLKWEQVISISGGCQPDAIMYQALLQCLSTQGSVAKSLSWHAEAMNSFGNWAAEVFSGVQS